MDYFIDVFTAFWALNVVPFLSVKGQKALGFDQNYPNLCSEDERRS